MQSKFVRRCAMIGVTVFGAAALLVSCKGGDSASPTQASATRSTSNAPMLMPAVTGAGALPVELKFGLGSAPKVGLSVSVTLVLTASSPQASVHLQARGEEGLEIEGSGELQIERLEPGTPQSLTMTLRGSIPGIHVVSVDVTTELAAGAPARAFQFPVLVTQE